MNILPLRLLLIDIANANDSNNRKAFTGVSMFPAKYIECFSQGQEKGMYLDRCVVEYSGYLCPRLGYEAWRLGWRRLDGTALMAQLWSLGVAP